MNRLLELVVACGISLTLAGAGAAAIGCAGSSKRADDSKTGGSQEGGGHAGGHEGGDHAGGGHEGEHGAMPPAVTAFHDVLSPLWHAPEGAKRTEDTCAAIPTFKEKAGDLVIAVPPEESDPTAFRDRTSALVHAVQELEAACAAGGRPDFAARFHDVHEAFHAVAEIP